MGSLYLWGRSIQEMGGDVVIGRSIYGVVVIDGSLCSRFYGICRIAVHSMRNLLNVTRLSFSDCVYIVLRGRHVIETISIFSAG